tara:strand:+ start:105 stop:689 length:585 start_codon:yes stop_codon:yes gene_type:complete
MPSANRSLELTEGVAAACETIKVLQEEGLLVEESFDDMDIASRIVEEFAATEDQPRQMPTAKVLSPTTPAAVRLTKNILDEYAHAVVERAVQLRHLVTNKLILDSDNADGKIRIRALELLGKISDVGLFTERSEVVVTHQSSSELEERLREKLRRLMGDGDIVDGELVETTEGGVDSVGLAKELGLEEVQTCSP